jgi:hypothetical protein
LRRQKYVFEAIPDKLSPAYLRICGSLRVGLPLCGGRIGGFIFAKSVAFFAGKRSVFFSKKWHFLVYIAEEKRKSTLIMWLCRLFFLFKSFPLHGNARRLWRKG